MNKLNSVLPKNVVVSFAIMSALILGAISYGFTNSFSSLGAVGQVAGVSEGANKVADNEYSSWIKSKNGGNFSPKGEDLDGDGLTNYEEFLLDTNPLNKNTCSQDKGDGQLLTELIDPKSCKPINQQSDAEFEKFSKVLDIKKVNQNLQDSKNVVTETSQIGDKSSILGLFGISSYDSLNSITTESIQNTVKLSSKKVEYLETIQKIDKYITQYRSYDVYDRDYAAPVSPAKYLDVSLKYNTPLKYVLALARNESRFGTDRFTNSGNLTRPGEYKNIYSIGLTETSSSGYNSWDDGVEAFGKWYKNLQDKGVSDCRKWRIYNPNGDYCTKIEGLASEIKDYLDK